MILQKAVFFKSICILYYTIIPNIDEGMLLICMP